jgi:excisionase family DNA binding protein
MERLLYPRRDAADLLSISLRKLDRMIRERAIRVVRIGRRTLVPREQLIKVSKHIS